MCSYVAASALVRNRDVMVERTLALRERWQSFAVLLPCFLAAFEGLSPKLETTTVRSFFILADVDQQFVGAHVSTDDVASVT